MEKFQNVIFKLAETHPNAPLTPDARTLLKDRLSRFVSQYKTPDHPPYSAMIERAIRELNEKRGSSEDSISRFLEKEYDNLPWAHSAMLKHHLRNQCASSFIVVTHNNRYKLPCEKEIPILNSQSAEVSKSKPPRRRTRQREKIKPRKGRLIRLRIRHEGKIVAVIEKHQEPDEKERLTLENVGNRVSSAAHTQNQPKSQQSVYSQPGTLKLGFVSPLVEDLPSPAPPQLPNEVNSQQQELGLSEIMDDDVSTAQTQEQHERQQSEHAWPEFSNPRGFKLPQVENLPNPGPAELLDGVSSQQQETAPTEITKADVSAAHPQEHTERQPSEYSWPEIPCFESPRVENLRNPGPSELPDEVHSLQQENTLSEITKADVSVAHTQEQHEGEKSVSSRPGIIKPPNFKPPQVENLPDLGPAELEPTSAKELFDSERARRQLRRWRNPGPTSGPEDNHLPLMGDFNLETPQVSVIEQMQLEIDGKSVKGVEKHSRKRKTEPKQPEFVLSKDKLPPQQPRRSPRFCLAKPQVTQDADYVIALPSHHCPTIEPVSSDSPTPVSSQPQKIVPPDIIYRRRRKREPNQSETIVTDEKEPQQLPEVMPPQREDEEQPRRSLRLSALLSLPCSEDCPESEPSKEMPVNQKWALEPVRPADETIVTYEKEPQQLLEVMPPQREDEAQPRRSLRLSALLSLPCSEDCPEIEPSKEKPVNQKLALEPVRPADETLVTDEKEPQQLPEVMPSQREDEEQPRRSLRLSALLSLPCSEDCLESEPSKENPVNQKWALEPVRPADETLVTDEKEPQQLPEVMPSQREDEEQPRRSLRLSALLSLPCSEDCLESEPSKENPVNRKWALEPVRPAAEGTEVEKLAKLRVGTPPKRRLFATVDDDNSNNNLKCLMMSPEIVGLDQLDGQQTGQHSKRGRGRPRKLIEDN